MLPVSVVLTGVVSLPPPLLLLIVATTLPAARIVSRTDLPGMLR